MRTVRAADEKGKGPVPYDSTNSTNISRFSTLQRTTIRSFFVDFLDQYGYLSTESSSAIASTQRSLWALSVGKMGHLQIRSFLQHLHLVQNLPWPLRIFKYFIRV